VLQCVACCSVLQCVAVCCNCSVLSSATGTSLLCHHSSRLCCSALQCVVVCCSMLQCVAAALRWAALPAPFCALLALNSRKATHHNTRQHTTTHDNTLQPTATHCSTLQHTATYYNALQHTVAHYNTLQRIATCCNTLQHTATHHHTLQHTATHCNTLQHTTTHCNTLQRMTTHEDMHLCKRVLLCEKSPIPAANEIKRSTVVCPISTRIEFFPQIRRALLLKCIALCLFTEK